MNTLVIVLIAAVCLLCGYMVYGRWLAKTWGIDPKAKTPAYTHEDGQDYVPTNGWIVFSHQFSSIAGAGPVTGAIQAAAFGWVPVLLWILVGGIFFGAVTDFGALYASVKNEGKSMGLLIEKYIGKTGKRLFLIFCWLFTLIVIAAFADMVAGTFNAYTVKDGVTELAAAAQTNGAAGSISIAFIVFAMFFGVLQKKLNLEGKGEFFVGLACTVASLAIGMAFPLIGGKDAWTGFTFAYIFFASVLPVWLLLLPRDYLSTFLKVGTILALALGIVFVMPEFKMPAITEFIHGGGPIVGGPVIPFIFITIACGALSGFHATIGTGTTPKMIGNEKDVLFVGYGAMLTEGFVGVMALVAACVLVPADYFAINAPAAKFAELGMQVQNLPMLEAEVQETLAARPGGSVSLAVGMAYIFSRIPWMEDLMAYWYHFAIMFEAVFILTAVDAGTRVGRFFLQEMIGRYISPKFNQKDWVPGIIITSVLFTGSWGYLVYSGDISSIWPLFGICNQLLASVTLLIGTTVLLRMNKGKYAWMTGVPGLLMTVITIWAGIWLVVNQYLPNGQHLLATLSCVVMLLMAFVIFGTLRRWMVLINMKTLTRDQYGVEVKEVVEE